LPRAGGISLATLRSTRKVLREQAYDVVLDLQGLWKSAVWARLAGAPRVVGFASQWRKEPASSFLIPEQVNLPEHVNHVVDKNLTLLRSLSIDAVGDRTFPLPRRQEHVDRIEHGLAEMGIGPFVILNPGGGWASKLWPAERFGELARALKERGLESLVTWGPGEERLADRVVEASGDTARRCFTTTLGEYAELARRARVVVAADTGPLHLACAVKTPVVALFGPTDPARNGPFDPMDGVVRRVPLCAPCYRRRCTAHEGVMKAIHTDEVVRAVERRLAHSSRPKIHA
jgi:heptosyltransferase-1